MQFLPTAPSPTVTHFMNLEALEAIDDHVKKKTTNEKNPEEKALPKEKTMSGRLLTGKKKGLRGKDKRLASRW